MTQKTLLALGGSRLLTPIIEAAHRLGHRVVTCDYLPDNFAHSLADEYRFASIVDQEAVLAVAHEIGADGVVSFAADPGVVSAAYVAEQLGLPFQSSYEVAQLLQSKDRFRHFLREHGFNSPETQVVAEAGAAAVVDTDIDYPVIVKPVDSAGSKGVTRVDSASELPAAIRHALGFSPSKTCIIETFIERQGPQLVAEGFTVNGSFEAICYMDHVFDEDGPNPYAPAGHIIPSQHDPSVLERLSAELQRLADLLHLRSGIYNIEARVGVDGREYIMEVSPRGGGNRLAEFAQAATGIDLVEATVRVALGEHMHLTAPRTERAWLQKVLFSRTAGRFNGIVLDRQFEDQHFHGVECWASEGDHVEPFTHASFAFGSMFLSFDDRAELDAFVRSSPIVVDVIPYDRQPTEFERGTT